MYLNISRCRRRNLAAPIRLRHACAAAQDIGKAPLVFADDERPIEALARPLAIFVVWAAAGLWIFLKGKLKVLAKIWVSVGLMGILVWVIFDRAQAQEVWERLATISVFWMLGAFLVKGTGMAATVWR